MDKKKILSSTLLFLILFCDMEGFTTLSEKLGNEEVYSLMDQVYEILIHKVHDYAQTDSRMRYNGSGQ